MSPGALAVLRAIRDHFLAQGEDPTAVDLSESVGLDAPNLVAALAELREWGLLQATSDDGGLSPGSVRYSIDPVWGT